MATVAVRQIAKSGRQTSHQAPENPRQHERPQSSRSAIGHANIPPACSPRKKKFSPKAKIPSAFLHWGFSCLGWLMGLEPTTTGIRSEEHTSELQSPCNLVCRLLLEKKKLINELDTQHIVSGSADG